MNGAATGPRLVGWKAIAAHLHLAIRTAQRWERDFGLPVRRIGNDRRDTVFAFADELDAWLVSASGAKALSRQLPDDGNGSHDEADESTRPDPAGDEVLAGGGPDAGDRRAPKPVRAVWLTIGALVLVVAATAVGAWLLTGRQMHDEPASVRVDGQSLVALDGSGDVLWRQPFGRLNQDYGHAAGRWGRQS